MHESATQLRSFWYPVARTSQLKARPLERRVNGQTIALFRDADGRPCALDARCPHRGDNLAHGRMERGCIVCPYHGWQFNGSGQCVAIPANIESKRVPPAFRARSFDVVEQQSFIWTCLTKTPAAPPPIFAELDEPHLRAFSYEDVVPIPFDWWIENVLDLAHIPFVHRATYGGGKATLDSYPVERRADGLGFSARTATNRRLSLIARLLHLSVGHFEMKFAVTHVMPGSTLFDIDLGKGKRQVLLSLATPENGQATRIWIIVLRNYFRVPGSDFVGKLFLRSVAREDIRTARRSLSHVNLAADRQFSTAADEPSLEFLRLLRFWRDREQSPD